MCRRGLLLVRHVGVRSEPVRRGWRRPEDRFQPPRLVRRAGQSGRKATHDLGEVAACHHPAATLLRWTTRIRRRFALIVTASPHSISYTGCGYRLSSVRSSQLGMKMCWCLPAETATRWDCMRSHTIASASCRSVKLVIAGFRSLRAENCYSEASYARSAVRCFHFSDLQGCAHSWQVGEAA
jgi:hypothetical protein